MGAFLIKESAHSFHILLQLGGPDGELGAATRYLSQRYTAPWGQIKAGLTDIGTEELAHIELVSAILYQLTKGLSVEEIKEGGMEAYFVDHTTGIYPQAASGVPFSASTLQSTGDIVCDLVEDLAAEQKARVTYDNILRLVDDPDVREPIKFLRAREIVHFQRFGDANHTDLSKKTSLSVMYRKACFMIIMHRFYLPDNTRKCIPGIGNRNLYCSWRWHR